MTINKDIVGLSIIEKPIFIVSFPRSGSTLLQCMLSAGSAAYSLPETHFFSIVLPGLKKKSHDAIPESELLYALEFTESTISRELPLDLKERLFTLAVKGKLNGKILLEHLLDSARPSHDSNRNLRVVEKTPRHVEYLQEILETFEDASFIYVVRDPKNAISSLLETDFIDTQWLQWHTERWNRAQNFVNSFSGDNTGIILSIRYEDLISDTERTLINICKFLGLPFDQTMTQEFSEQLQFNAVISKEPWKSGVLGGTLVNRTDVWRNRIDPGSAWLIERDTKEAMNNHGYESAICPTWWVRVGSRWDMWTAPRRDVKAQEKCARLAFEYQESGNLRKAGRYATQLVFTNWKWLRNRNIRHLLYIFWIMRSYYLDPNYDK